jgi:hypothetical protein
MVKCTSPVDLQESENPLVARAAMHLDFARGQHHGPMAPSRAKILLPRRRRPCVTLGIPGTERPVANMWPTAHTFEAGQGSGVSAIGENPRADIVGLLTRCYDF